MTSFPKYTTVVYLGSSETIVGLELLFLKNAAVAFLRIQRGCVGIGTRLTCFNGLVGLKVFLSTSRDASSTGK
jgi:hypothetical protein